MPTADQRPLHAVAEMTTYELAGYRRNLERGLAVITEDGATRDVLRSRLDMVVAEQDERARIRANG